jgi:6-phospho 3-hexuloisomerase
MKVQATLDEICDNIRNYRETDVDPERVKKFVQMILGARRVFVYGAGRSGLVGKCFAQRLMHLGLQAYALGETITPSMARKDVLICISGSGGTTSTLAIERSAKRLGAKTIAVTGHPESPLARMAGLVFFVRGKTKVGEHPSLAPFTSLFDITTLAVLDSLCAEIMDKLGATEQTILRAHATVE